MPAVPIGPRGVQAQMTANVPKGPKAGRFKDKDRVDPSSSTAGLDYGDSVSSSKSRSASPTKPSKLRRERSYSAADSYSDRSKSYSRSLSRSRSPTPPRREKSSRSKRDTEKSTGSSSRRDKEKERESSNTSKRKREQSGLGPGGWEDEGEQEVRRGSRLVRVEHYALYLSQVKADRADDGGPSQAMMRNRRDVDAKSSISLEDRASCYSPLHVEYNSIA